MTEFTKMKISFALALLGTLFALHPFLDRFDDAGFVYLGADLKVFYAYSLTAGLLSLCVYFFAVTLMGDRPHSWFEKTGNYLYALAILVLPIYGGLFLSARLADQVAVSHVAWAAPAVALGLGGGWLALTQLIAWRIHGRLGHQDRVAKMAQLARQEIEALKQARELLEHEHYDLSVVEACRALEARLRQVLLGRGVSRRLPDRPSVIAVSLRKGIVPESTQGILDELQRHWAVAVSTEPLSREEAVASLSATRHILATIPAPNGHGSPRRPHRAKPPAPVATAAH
jgi:HEPN domain-containing protein